MIIIPQITKVKFKEEKQRYRVMAASDRYLICTKPFNPRRTVLYTIVDLREKIRGADNLVFGFGYETLEDCKENLERLERGDMEISHRNRVDLNIEAFS